MMIFIDLDHDFLLGCLCRQRSRFSEAQSDQRSGSQLPTEVRDICKRGRIVESCSSDFGLCADISNISGRGPGDKGGQLQTSSHRRFQARIFGL